jgi:asparagine synthase (glutamine-hydrolysing)
MCGICGIVDKDASQPRLSREILTRMSDVIIHRGPDSDGLMISEDRRCGFAFRRLSIIDLSNNGSQPISTPDGRYTIVFNGEIYNHAKIREELIAKGYKYRSNTDTETILYGYQEWGEEIVEKLVGMWGFAIWDSQEKSLFCSRDRIGIKPLYFYFRDGLLVFGSEVKSILQHPDIVAEMNYEEVPNYLNFAMSGSSTLFKNIHKLPAGHKLKLKNGDLKIERYWSPINPEQQYTKMDAREIQEHTVHLLRQAVEDRMMSDVPFGVFLSGGVDSSLNVALMSELMNRPVDTYTVGFKELEEYNELGYAKQVSDLFKTNHNEILIDHKDAFPILEDLAWHEDEPNADPVCIPLWFLSKLTKDSGTTVIQVGEGSDEQFIGYKWMLREYNFYKTYWRFFNAMPQGLRKAVYQAAKPIFRAKQQLQALDYLRRGAYNEELYWSGLSVFSPSHTELLFNKDYHNLIGEPYKRASAMHQDALSQNPNLDYLQRMTYTELVQRLPELLLMRVDKIGMAHSIEARVPFLDHRLVEFTMSIPPHHKVPGKNLTKDVLKKAVEDILPHNIIYRKKMGFWAPVNEWMRSHWYEFAKSKLLDSHFVKSGFFNKDYLSSILEANRTGKHNYGFPIFSLMMLTLWHERFIEKK